MPNHQNEIDAIEPILKIAKIFAIVPPYQIINKYGILKYKCYSIILIQIIFWTYIFTFDMNRKKQEELVGFVLFRISLTVSVTSHILGILLINFWNVKQFEQLVQYSYDIDKRLQTKRCLNRIYIRVHFEIFLLHFIIFIGIIYHLWMTIRTLAIYAYFKYLSKNIQDYWNGILVLIVSNYCRWLRSKFCILNDHLADVQQSHKKDDVFKLDVIHVTSRDNIYNTSYNTLIQSITDARKMYTDLKDLMDLFNNIFGWQILFVFADVVLVLIETIDAAINDNSNIKIQLSIFVWFIINAVGD